MHFMRVARGLGRGAVPGGLLCLAPSTWPGQGSNPQLTQLLACSSAQTATASPARSRNSWEDGDPHTYRRTYKYTFTLKNEFTDYIPSINQTLN